MVEFSFNAGDNIVMQAGTNILLHKGWAWSVGSFKGEIHFNYKPIYIHYNQEMKPNLGLTSGGVN